MKKIPPFLLFLALCPPLAAQFGLSSMEPHPSEFLINQAPFKSRYDPIQYRLVPAKDAAGNYGFVNEVTGDTLVPFRYDTVGNFWGGPAPVHKKEGWGFVNMYGTEIGACRYDSVGEWEGGICQVVSKGKKGLLYYSGRTIIPAEFDDIRSAGPGLYWVEKNKLYGLYHRDGRELSRPRFEEVDYFSEERAWVKQNGKWAIVNPEGVMLIAPRYEAAQPFNEGMAVVMLHDLYGYVNKEGEEQIFPMYYNAHGFNNGLAAVETDMESGRHYIYINKKDSFVITSHMTRADAFSDQGFAVISRGEGQTGLIDKTGAEIVPCEFESLGELQDSMIAVSKEGKWGYYKISGRNAQLVIPLRFDEAGTFYDGEALVKSGDSYYINKKGAYVKAYKEYTGENEVTDSTGSDPFAFSIDYINTRGERVIRGDAGAFSTLIRNDLAPVMKEGKWGYLDKSGAKVVACQYEGVSMFNEGLGAARKNGKWGYIYRDNDTLTGFVFDYAFAFSDGLAVVKQNGKYGYLDKTGKLHIPCRYDMAYAFTDSLAPVRIGTRFGYINKNGETVIPVMYEDGFGFYDGMASVQQNGRWGFVDGRNQVVVPFLFDEVYPFTEKLAAARMDDRWGFIDTRGQWVVPCRYARVTMYSGGVAIAQDPEGDWVLLDKYGNETWTGQLRSRFYDGLAIVEDENGKKGFIDRNGRLVIPYRYDEALIFSQGFAAVAIGEKWGFVNTTGQLVIPMQFDAAFLFSEGLAMIANVQKK